MAKPGRAKTAVDAASVQGETNEHMVKRVTRELVLTFVIAAISFAIPVLLVNYL